MKLTWGILGMMLLGLMPLGHADEAAIVGGYFNSARRIAALTLRDEYRIYTIYNRAQGFTWGRPSDSDEGHLYIISARGRVSVRTAAFTDREGHRIDIPKEGYDKLVYLNHYNHVKALVGGSEKEFLQFIPEALHSDALIVLNAQRRPLFAALEYSGHVLEEMRGMTHEVLDMLASSVGWMAGAATEALVRKVMTIGIAHGDDAVSQGGDGKGGDALVDPIAQGGDGKGGDAVVDPNAVTGVTVQSITTITQLPAPVGVNAMTNGKLIVIE